MFPKQFARMILLRRERRTGKEGIAQRYQPVKAGAVGEGRRVDVRRADETRRVAVRKLHVVVRAEGVRAVERRIERARRVSAGVDVARYAVRTDALAGRIALIRGEAVMALSVG